MIDKKIKAVDLAYVGLSAAMIAICSWISVPVGAVPVTLQTLAVCLVSGLFGAKRGTAATLIYILIGAVGLPVFSGFKGGAGVLLGATGGYIIGFIFTALAVGFVSDKTDKKTIALIASMAFGILLCYAFGTAWFCVLYAKSAGAVLSMCVFPFIIPDTIKIALAVFLTSRLKKFIK